MAIKRPRIGSDIDPGLRAIRALLNKITESNFDAIQAKVVDLVVSGGVAARTVVEALLEKSSNDGDGFTMAYTRLLSAITTICDLNIRTSALKCIGEFLHEIYGTGDVLWNEVKSVSDATVRFKPTEDYDGFCAALKAKKKIYGRHKTALTILSLMAKDIAGIPRPADAASKLLGLMKRAVDLNKESAEDNGYKGSKGVFHCLEVEDCGGDRSNGSNGSNGSDMGDETDTGEVKIDGFAERCRVRDAAIEILLELVSQLAATLSAVKKEAFVGTLKALQSGLQDTLTDQVINSCGTQCHFRAEAIVAKLDKEVRLASAALVKKETVLRLRTPIHEPIFQRHSHSTHASHASQPTRSDDSAHKAAAVAIRGTQGTHNTSGRATNGSAIPTPIPVIQKNRPTEGVSWRSVVGKT